MVEWPSPPLSYGKMRPSRHLTAHSSNTCAIGPRPRGRLGSSGCGFAPSLRDHICHQRQAQPDPQLTQLWRLGAAEHRYKRNSTPATSDDDTRNASKAIEVWRWHMRRYADATEVWRPQEGLPAHATPLYNHRNGHGDASQAPADPIIATPNASA